MDAGLENVTHGFTLLMLMAISLAVQRLRLKQQLAVHPLSTLPEKRVLLCNVKVGKEIAVVVTIGVFARADVLQHRGWMNPVNAQAHGNYYTQRSCCVFDISDKQSKETI
jgi:hypothetical protein